MSVDGCSTADLAALPFELSSLDRPLHGEMSVIL
jgi:hypothetical protein